MENKASMNVAVYGIINDCIRRALDNYYKNQDADSFFKLVEYMDSCRFYGLDQNQIPCFIEMQNVIVMG